MSFQVDLAETTLDALDAVHAVDRDGELRRWQLFGSDEREIIFEALRDAFPEDGSSRPGIVSMLMDELQVNEDDRLSTTPWPGKRRLKRIEEMAQTASRAEE